MHDDGQGAATQGVRTGALDEHYWRQAIWGLLAWLVTVLAVVWFLVAAPELAFDIVIFLVAVGAMVAILLVALAVEVFRKPLIHGRAKEARPLAEIDDPAHDALGRLVAPPAAGLDGEVTLVLDRDVRRYRTSP